LGTTKMSDVRIQKSEFGAYVLARRDVNSDF
jgi:hypothetical protein